MEKSNPNSYVTPTKNPLKRFCCWVGWHGTRTHLRMDECNIHAKCDWCGYEGMIDSQGNLF